MLPPPKRLPTHCNVRATSLHPVCRAPKRRTGSRRQRATTSPCRGPGHRQNGVVCPRLPIKRLREVLRLHSFLTVWLPRGTWTSILALDPLLAEFSCRSRASVSTVQPDFRATAGAELSRTALDGLPFTRTAGLPILMLRGSAFPRVGCGGILRAEDYGLGAGPTIQREECQCLTVSVGSVLTCTRTSRRSRSLIRRPELSTRRVVGRPYELLPWLRGVKRPARMVVYVRPGRGAAGSRGGRERTGSSWWCARRGARIAPRLIGSRPTSVTRSPSRGAWPRGRPDRPTSPSHTLPRPARNENQPTPP